VKAAKTCAMLTLLLINLVFLVHVSAAGATEQFVQAQVLATESSTPSLLPVVAWQNIISGDLGVSANQVIQTSDGGYAVVGDGNDKTFSPGALVKLDSSGNIQWNKNYSIVDLKALMQAKDGGFALAGYDFRGTAGALLVKTDLEGNALWNQTYGNIFISSILQTANGDYILGGNTIHLYESTVYGSDFWLAKVNSAGTLQWSKTYGGTGDEAAYSVVQTADGGYAMAGGTASFGFGGGTDFWFVKTDSEGNLQWSKTFGEKGDNEARSVIQTIDGGYVLGGNTNGYGAGGTDAWLIKTDSSGNMVWNKTYFGAGVLTERDGIPTFPVPTSNGSGDDSANCLIQTSDGGLAFTGTRPSYVSVDSLVWLVKTDASGNMQWNQTFPQSFGGTSSSRSGNSLIETSDGALAIAGFQQVPSFPWIGTYYVIKTEPVLPPPSTSPSASPTSTLPSGGPGQFLTFPSTTIRADGSVDPVTAPIQRSGNIYEATGDSYGSLVIEKDDVIVDGSGHFLLGNGTFGDLFIRKSETGIALVDRSNVTVKNFQAEGFVNSIFVSGSARVTVTNVTTAGNDVGIFVSDSMSTFILSNLLTQNSRGISITDSSRTRISDNYIQANGRGILLYNANGSLISGDTIRDSQGGGFSGIEVRSGSNNIFCGNLFQNVTDGIFFVESSSATVVGNNFIDNSGLLVYSTSGCKIYCNNFIDSSAARAGDQENSWDNGTVGNYWGSYLQVYPDASEIDNSGIWNTPYVLADSQVADRVVLSVNNTDHHPLMSPVTDSEALGLQQTLEQTWDSQSSPSPSADMLFDWNLVLLASLAIVAVVAVVAVAVLKSQKKHT
jgi:parallel beta-helix repeat protein